MEGNTLSINNSMPQCPDLNLPMTREGMEFGIAWLDYLMGNMSSAKMIAISKDFMPSILPNMPLEKLYENINEQVAACSVALGYM